MNFIHKYNNKNFNTILDSLLEININEQTDINKQNQLVNQQKIAAPGGLKSKKVNRSLNINQNQNTNPTPTPTEPIPASNSEPINNEPTNIDKKPTINNEETAPENKVIPDNKVIPENKAISDNKEQLLPIEQSNSEIPITQPKTEENLINNNEKSINKQPSINDLNSTKSIPKSEPESIPKSEPELKLELIPKSDNTELKKNIPTPSKIPPLKSKKPKFKFGPMRPIDKRPTLNEPTPEISTDKKIPEKTLNIEKETIPEVEIQKKEAPSEQIKSTENEKSLINSDTTVTINQTIDKNITENIGADTTAEGQNIQNNTKVITKLLDNFINMHKINLDEINTPDDTFTSADTLKKINKEIINEESNEQEENFALSAQEKTNQEREETNKELKELEEKNQSSAEDTIEKMLFNNSESKPLVTSQQKEKYKEIYEKIKNSPNFDKFFDEFTSKNIDNLMKLFADSYLTQDNSDKSISDSISLKNNKNIELSFDSAIANFNQKILNHTEKEEIKSILQNKDELQKYLNNELKITIPETITTIYELQKIFIAIYKAVFNNQRPSTLVSMETAFQKNILDILNNFMNDIRSAIFNPSTFDDNFQKNTSETKIYQIDTENNINNKDIFTNCVNSYIDNVINDNKPLNPYQLAQSKQIFLLPLIKICTLQFCLAKYSNLNNEAIAYDPSKKLNDIQAEPLLKLTNRTKKTNIQHIFIDSSNIQTYQLITKINNLLKINYNKIKSDINNYSTQVRKLLTPQPYKDLDKTIPKKIPFERISWAKLCTPINNTRYATCLKNETHIIIDPNTNEPIESNIGEFLHTIVSNENTLEFKETNKNNNLRYQNNDLRRKLSLAFKYFLQYMLQDLKCLRVMQMLFQKYQFTLDIYKQTYDSLNNKTYGYQYTPIYQHLIKQANNNDIDLIKNIPKEYLDPYAKCNQQYLERFATKNRILIRLATKYQINISDDNEEEILSHFFQSSYGKYLISSVCGTGALGASNRMGWQKSDDSTRQGRGFRTNLRPFIKNYFIQKESQINELNDQITARIKLLLHNNETLFACFPKINLITNGYINAKIANDSYKDLQDLFTSDKKPDLLKFIIWYMSKNLAQNNELKHYFRQYVMQPRVIKVLSPRILKLIKQYDSVITSGGKIID